MLVRLGKPMPSWRVHAWWARQALAREDWRDAMLWLVVVVVLVLMLGGGGWGYRSGYYGRSAYGGGIGLIVLIVVLVLLFGRGGGVTP